MFGLSPLQLLILVGVVGGVLGILLVLLAALLSVRRKDQGPDYQPERLEER